MIEQSTLAACLKPFPLDLSFPKVPSERYETRVASAASCWCWTDSCRSDFASIESSSISYSHTFVSNKPLLPADLLYLLPVVGPVGSRLGLPLAMAKPPKYKGTQKAKGKGKKAASKVIDEDDDGGYESGSDNISLGSLHSANSEYSLASWNSRDQRSAFADFEALDSLNAMRDEEGYRIYNVEGILRWRRHPRRGFTQYRLVVLLFHYWSGSK